MFGNDIKTTSQCEQLLCEICDIMAGFAYNSGVKEPEEVLAKAKKIFLKLEA